MTVQTIGPTASNHDASEDGPGAITLTGAVQLTAATNWGGLFLASVAAARTDTINSATAYYKAGTGVHDSPALTWYAQAADTAAVFTTTTDDISSRPRTTASTNDTAVDIGTTNWRSVNITSQIAEVVARAGWVAGNHIALILDGETDVNIYMTAWDNGGDVWYVEIDYSSAGQPMRARGRQVPGMRRPHGHSGW